MRQVHTPQPIHFAKTTWENNSLCSEMFGDIYFSVHGGRQESSELYLEGNQLAERFSNCNNFVVGEIGFGTALNFALTLELWNKCSRDSSQLFYISYEKYPVPSSQMELVLLSQGVNLELVDRIVSNLPLPIEAVHIIDLPEYRTRLLLNYGDAAEKLKETSAKVDAWYLDGFAPSKNPDCWSEEVLLEVSRLSHSKTTASTYSVSGLVRQRLSQLNWNIEKFPGSGKKKESLRAKFNGPDKTSSSQKNFKVSVVGAGLSGCAIAESFVRRGAEVSLYESRPGLAMAASGNQFGVVLPYPSRARDIPQRYYTASFLYLNSLLKRFGPTTTGVLFQPLKDRKGGFYTDYSRYEYPKEFAQIVSASESSKLAGINLNKPSLYFPSGGAVNFPDFCRSLTKQVNNIYLNTKVASISELAEQFDITVLASGSDFELLPKHIQSFVYPLKGETGVVSATAESQKLKIPICDTGYLCPSFNGGHLVGSTYERGVSDESLSENGEFELGKVFNSFFPEVSAKFVSRRAGIRVASKDRMPIIGEVQNETRGLRVLVSTAHGSRGGVTAFLAAELLVARIYGEPEPMEMRLAKAIGVERIK